MSSYRISQEAYKQFRPFIIGFWIVQSITLFGLSVLAARIVLPEEGAVQGYYYGQYVVQWGTWIVCSLWLFKRTVISYDTDTVWKPAWFIRQAGIFIGVLLASFCAEFGYRQLVALTGLGPSITAAELVSMYLLQIGTFLMKYFFIVGFSQAICYLYYIKAKEVEKARMEKEHSRLQYQFLSMQIRPHFIFNAQHTIHSLIETGENKKASSMLLHLSALMRNMINYSQRDTITLQEEIENLEHYVTLQLIRLGDEITVHFDIAAETAGCLLPGLTLQPIVENCFQHAFGESGKGNIQVSAQRAAKQLIIRVTDDGKGIDVVPPKKESYGLRNITDRLDNLYGGQASLSAKTAVPHGTTVELSLPVDV